MKRRNIFLVTIMLLIICFAGCGEIEDYNSEIMETQDNVSDSPAVDEGTQETTGEYYLNGQGILVDKVEEFETQAIGEYTIKYPILDDGVDEVVVYGFDTYDNVHIIIDASNVYQQTSLDEIGDYGDVQLELVASGKDIVYMFDGECYYIEDYSINLLTISKPMGEKTTYR